MCEVLSIIPRLYDPLCILNPGPAKAKIILRRLWQQKTNGDDLKSNPIIEQWTEFVTAFKCTQKVKMSRLFLADAWLNLQGFADSFETAYKVIA
ncbi:hypothetical protein TNCT_442631 [Trichonephila clavata]|uniref:Uncharacterized protein n=1 Tax=Trichonephila clavata TaxID=2740835 RepID=A0A8X6HI89_TRICU|nr:hypothetical protein TNCT_442631 [Trichonephila clavata]